MHNEEKFASPQLRSQDVGDEGVSSAFLVGNLKVEKQRR